MKNRICGTVILCVFAICFPLARAVDVKVGDVLPLWNEGCLDIHHINTGRGESSLIIMPDGTTMLVDAGAINVKGRSLMESVPDDSREPGEWIARYIKRATAAMPGRSLNYMLLTHFHSDHMGKHTKDSKDAPAGGYKLVGITEVAEFVPFEKIMDRGWPDYDFPAPQKAPEVLNYRKFLDWQIANKGLVAEGFKVGVKDQIVLRNNPAKYPDFEIRNLAASGVVWTGTGSETRNHFPDPKTLKPGAIIENNCSIAFRLTYGAFDYFSGGDLSVAGMEFPATAEPWMDIERPVALVTGAVDVMKANHHGYRDANSAFFLGTLRPRVIVIDTWHVAQPSANSYHLMRSGKTWPGARDIFITNQTEAARLATQIDRKGPPPGHVVIRVSPGGAEYRVYVIEEESESGRVKSVHGPYKSR